MLGFLLLSYFRLSLDASSVPFHQNMTDRISGSLDDILAYEDMQSVRSSYASQSAFMGILLHWYCG